MTLRPRQADRIELARLRKEVAALREQRAKLTEALYELSRTFAEFCRVLVGGEARDDDDKRKEKQ